MKIAVVGATGLVGSEMLEVIKEEQLPFSQLIPVASEKSKGSTVLFNGKPHTVVGMNEALAMKPHVAIFAAGGSTSLEWAPKFAEIGCVVIDNSSAWRMHPDKKLIVPEINGHLIEDADKIIANPNCSTIQLLMVLAPLHKKYGIQRVVVSTYQSITGTGIKALNQMENERRGIEGEMAYKYEIDKNCIPQCDDFMDNGYTKEEMKLTNETKKILDPSIEVTATAVRVPVMGGHSEAVNISFEQDFDLKELKSLLHHTPGVVVQDDPENAVYPMPKNARSKNEVFVGRIRRDFSQAKSLNLWIVADNLRKGAATNAVQIAQIVMNK